MRRSVSEYPALRAPTTGTSRAGRANTRGREKERPHSGEEEEQEKAMEEYPNRKRKENTEVERLGQGQTSKAPETQATPSRAKDYTSKLRKRSEDEEMQPRKAVKTPSHRRQLKPKDQSVVAETPIANIHPPTITRQAPSTQATPMGSKNHSARSQAQKEDEKNPLLMAMKTAKQNKNTKPKDRNPAAEMSTRTERGAKKATRPGPDAGISGVEVNEEEEEEGGGTPETSDPEPDEKSQFANTRMHVQQRPGEVEGGRRTRQSHITVKEMRRQIDGLAKCAKSIGESFEAFADQHNITDEVENDTEAGRKAALGKRKVAPGQEESGSRSKKVKK